MNSKLKATIYAVGLILLAITVTVIVGGVATVNPKMPNLYAPNYTKKTKDHFFMKVLKRDIDPIIKRVIMVKPDRAREINKFNMETVGGGAIDTEKFKGQVTLIYVWGASLRTARQDIAQIAELKNKYGDKGFAPYGIVVRSNKEELDAFTGKKPLPFDTALAEDDSPVAIGFIPANIFLDKQARVRAYITGEVEEGVREFIIEKLLKE